MKLPLEGRWLALIALVALVFVGGLMIAVRFVRLPEVEKLAVGPAETGLGIAVLDAEEDSARLEEQALFAPDPLFLPTPYNASELAVPELRRREPGAAFAPGSAKLTYSVDAATIPFPEVFPMPARAVDSLIFGKRDGLYPVLGRFATEEPALPARMAFIEVIQSKTGRTVYSAALTIDDAPEAIRSANWRPLELLTTVDASGMIGLPVVASGSGVASIDSFFRSYLAKAFHLGERLPPGFYILHVGP
jgi:hypothetical protein